MPVLTMLSVEDVVVVEEELTARTFTERCADSSGFND